MYICASTGNIFVKMLIAGAIVLVGSDTDAFSLEIFPD